MSRRGRRQFPERRGWRRRAVAAAMFALVATGAAVAWLVYIATEGIHL